MNHREAYLDALGLTSWVRREPGAALPAHASPVSHAPPIEPPIEPPARESQASGRQASVIPMQAAKAQGLVLGPGQGSCLFVCGADDDRASLLASDLARLLPEAPVWAHAAPGGEGTSLEIAVAERLFTLVVFFGQASVLLSLGQEAPANCGPARVLVLSELRRLAQDAEARKACWQALKTLGLGRRQ